MTAVPIPVRRRLPRPAPTRGRRRHLRVVQPPRRRHTVLFTILYLAVAAGAVFGAVSFTAVAAGDAVRARELERAVVDAERSYGQLVAEVARLEHPERVARAALELGMIPADTPRYLPVRRALAADGAPAEAVIGPGETTDPLKPVLSATP